MPIYQSRKVNNTEVPPDSTIRWGLILAKEVDKIVVREDGISNHRRTGLGQPLTAEDMTIPQDLKVEDIITAKRARDIIERGVAVQAEEVAVHIQEVVVPAIREKETVKEAILVATGGGILDLQLKRVSFRIKISRLDIRLNKKDNILQNEITKNLVIKVHTR